MTFIAEQPSWPPPARFYPSVIRSHVLRLVEPLVEAAFGDQGAVVTNLCDASVLEDEYPIRNCGNEIHVVADDHARAVARIAADHAGQPCPLVGVEVLGRLVEQQDLRPAQQAARQRDQSLLSARRHLHVHHRVVAVVHLRRVDDDRVHVGLFAGLLDISVAGVRSRQRMFSRIVSLVKNGNWASLET